MTVVTIRVRFAWWLRYYLAGVALMSRFTGCEPDAEKVAQWIRRGVVLVVTLYRT